MNAVERILSDDVARLMDRLAASIPEGTLGQMPPASRARLDETEANLAAARAWMVEGYGRWRRILDDVENLWALAAWRRAAEEPRRNASGLAA
jgi:hypothetical protein